MILESSKSLNCPSAKAKSSHTPAELKSLVLQLMRTQGLDTDNLPMTAEGTIDISNIPGMKLHSLMLHAEEMGLNIKFTKKTVVEIG